MDMSLFIPHTIDLSLSSLSSSPKSLSYSSISFLSLRIRHNSSLESIRDVLLCFIASLISVSISFLYSNSCAFISVSNSLINSRISIRAFVESVSFLVITYLIFSNNSFSSILFSLPFILILFSR